MALSLSSLIVSCSLLFHFHQFRPILGQNINNFAQSPTVQEFLLDWPIRPIHLHLSDGFFSTTPALVECTQSYPAL